MPCVSISHCLRYFQNTNCTLTITGKRLIFHHCRYFHCCLADIPVLQRKKKRENMKEKMSSFKMHFISKCISFIVKSSFQNTIHVFWFFFFKTEIFYKNSFQKVLCASRKVCFWDFIPKYISCISNISFQKFDYENLNLEILFQKLQKFVSESFQNM